MILGERSLIFPMGVGMSVNLPLGWMGLRVLSSDIVYVWLWFREWKMVRSWWFIKTLQNMVIMVIIIIKLIFISIILKLLWRLRCQLLYVMLITSSIWLMIKRLFCYFNQIIITKQTQHGSRCWPLQGHHQWSLHLSSRNTQVLQMG